MTSPVADARLHPAVERAAWELAREHARTHPDLLLVIIYGHRSVAEQVRAVKGGHSQLDPRRGRFSLHLYDPSLAVDLWVYSGALAARQALPVLSFGRPDRELGLRLELGRGDLARFYWPIHALAAGHGLEPLRAPSWSRVRQRFVDGTGDGPHLQFPSRARVAELQALLGHAAIRHRYAALDPGPVDGIAGRKTLAAIRAIERIAPEVEAVVSRRQRRVMPIAPAGWSWLQPPAQELAA